MSAYFVPFLLQGRSFLITGKTGGAGSRVAMEIERCGGSWYPLERGEIPSGKYDGVFHAAGHEVIAPLKEIGGTAHDPALAIAIKLLDACGSRDGLVKDGGSVVFMSSVAAVRGTAGMSLYSASKAAIEGLVRSAAVELAPRKIRVNAIRAGGFRSPMHERISHQLTEEQHRAYFAKHPLGFGTTEDIANAALFLLSDASKWVTGTALTIDGGFSAR